MAAARRALALAFLASLATLAPSALGSSAPATPTGLRAFELRPNERAQHTFSRTPAFAWNPVHGAACYEFELATSRSFNGSSVIWSNASSGPTAGSRCRSVKVRFAKAPDPGSAGGQTGSSAGSGSGSNSASSSGSGSTSGSGPSAETVVETIPAIRIPAVAVDLTLPWFNGKAPYALYAHVRSVTIRGASAWSSPFGFNMRWENTPTPLSSRAGVLRWTPIEGATSYQVWFGKPGALINKLIVTHTNVVDERDLYSFHLDDAWFQRVSWRVRAVRQVVGAVPNGLPAVTYGPWTTTYTVSNPAWVSGTIRLGPALSDRTSSGIAPPHELMPALTWTGDQALDGSTWRLFRTYVFTDRDCVNAVFVGSVVGSPAFAPRINGPLKLPADQTTFDKALTGVLPNTLANPSNEFAADTTSVVPNETVTEGQGLLHVDLPDLDPASTRYYWTVVPVTIQIDDSGQFTYVDYESPQDACAAGRIGVFGKNSDPVITTSGSPYVSGLSPSGRLLAQAGRRPTVYSSPLVAWRPVVGATGYEVQWSRTTYPWRASGRLGTVATTAVLRLPSGLWYYRVRGLNLAQVGTAAMTWSAPVAVRVVRPTFAIHR